ncbi:hypothetical protein VQ042_12590 [Aurantimonas sp. A2-1-M11]|uniref:hypothetical protein n=1 Tax=Aurantimonas sp. A2-1-M11 TaxID=3113712 RepID=UPI002F92A0D2
MVIGTLVLLAGVTPARAVHGDHTVEQWHEARYICKMGKDRDGARVIEPERDAICHALERMSLVLLENNHCWNWSEKEWLPVGQDDRFCRQSN